MSIRVLQGVYDLHIHTAPDVVSRKCSDRIVARRMRDAGMRGGAIKSHYFETAARAKLLAEEFPELKIVGGVTLNRSVGGLNPEIVKKVGAAGGKMLWFPTMDAYSFQKNKRGNEDFDTSSFLVACDRTGDLKAEVFEILKTAWEYDMVVGTGHLSPDEGMKIVEAAHEQGIKKIVLTHAEHPAVAYSIAQQRNAAQKGAYIEHSFNNVWFKRCSMESFVEQIRKVGPEHVILTGDFGQPDAPYFDEALRMYIEKITEFFSGEAIDRMTRKNPEALIS